MNIIIVHQWFEKNATFKHIVYLANNMVKMGHKVLLISHKDIGTPHDVSNEILFDYMPCKINLNKLDQNFINKIQAFKPDIVHSFSNQYVLYIAYLIKKETNAKLIVHYEDNLEQIFFNKLPLIKVLKLLLSGLLYLDIWVAYNLILERRVRKHIDGYDVLTNPLKKMLEDQLVNKPIKHLYPPADLTLFNPDIDGSYIREELKIKDKFVLVHSGTIYCHWLEGFKKFLEGVALAHEDIPNLQLVFTGKTVGDETKFFDIINQLDLNEITIYQSYIKKLSEVPAYLAMADVLFNPQTLYEFDEYRLPSKLHNYMASGRAIISASNGFIRDLSDDEMIKVDFENEIAQNICDKIIYLHQNPDIRTKMGFNARKKAELLFNPEKNTKQLIDFYKEIINDIN